MLEIGAGLGSLTLALAETGATVVALETDRHLVPVLRSVVEPAGVEVVEGDAMTVDLAALLAERAEGPWSLVANLPYNVATPLVLRALVEVPAVADLLVMVQREVGERMAAAAGDDAYGAVSVRIAYFARAEVVGRVPPSVFIPRPRVESVLVRLARLPGACRRPCPGHLRAPGRGRAGRLRPAAQDAPPLPGGRGGARGVRAGRGAARRPGRGARHRGMGEAGGTVTPAPAVTVPAPAKLTVSLRVTGVRADGYHELDAEMVTLDLADELVFTDGESGLVVVAEPGTHPDRLPPAEHNLIGRALAVCGRSASVRLTKRIPLGGGLGGGSADAAAVLRWSGCTRSGAGGEPRCRRALLRGRRPGPGRGGRRAGDAAPLRGP